MPAAKHDALEDTAYKQIQPRVERVFNDMLTDGALREAHFQIADLDVSQKDLAEAVRRRVLASFDNHIVGGDLVNVSIQAFGSDCIVIVQHK